jgi:hypothetical protein
MVLEQKKNAHVDPIPSKRVANEQGLQVQYFQPLNCTRATLVAALIKSFCCINQIQHFYLL